MGLITKYVEIYPVAQAKYYESLGYYIPKRINANRKLVYDKTKPIFVKVSDLPNMSGMKVDVKCDCCEKLNNISYHIYKHTYDKYDNYYCHNCIITLFNSGSNCAAWNNFLTDEERIAGRNYKEYKDFIKRTLERDNYTCQCCGSTENFEIHHLNAYSWFVEGRTDERNAITLCKNCHYNFHSKYGRHNNTKEQFMEWMNVSTLELGKFNGVLPSTKMIYSYEEDKVYTSVFEFMNIHNVKYNSQVYGVCNHHRKTVKGKHLFWLDEYKSMTQEELQVYLS